MKSKQEPGSVSLARAAAGRKNKSSPWRKYPHVKKAQNWRRKQGWEGDEQG